MLAWGEASEVELESEMSLVGLECKQGKPSGLGRPSGVESRLEL